MQLHGKRCPWKSFSSQKWLTVKSQKWLTESLHKKALQNTFNVKTRNSSSLNSGTPVKELADRTFKINVLELRVLEFKTFGHVLYVLLGVQLPTITKKLASNLTNERNEPSLGLHLCVAKFENLPI